MRALLAVTLLPGALVLLLQTGCTPYIPVKDDFGTTALAPTGDIPPEFAEFNAFDPTVNPLLEQQMCPTPYQPLEASTLGASSGNLLDARGRCRTHVPFFGE